MRFVVGLAVVGGVMGVLVVGVLVVVVVVMGIQLGVGVAVRRASLE